MPPQYTRLKDNTGDVTSKAACMCVLAVGGSSGYREKTQARVEDGSGLRRRDDGGLLQPGGPEKGQENSDANRGLEGKADESGMNGDAVEEAEVGGDSVARGAVEEAEVGGDSGARGAVEEANDASGSFRPILRARM
jgi:hypothetical protein